VYEELEKHGFPVGLLPTSVKKYKLHDDGKFKVDLYSSCSFTADTSKDSFHIYYKKKVKGRIHTDIIKDLEGVIVKVKNYDLSIEKVVRDFDLLNFYGGSYTAAFPVTDFNKSPECGCGLDCSGNSTELVQSA
jgi:hypothetical protein